MRKSAGIFGSMYRTHLEQNNPKAYRYLLMSGDMESTLKEIQELTSSEIELRMSQEAPEKGIHYLEIQQEVLQSILPLTPEEIKSRHLGVGMMDREIDYLQAWVEAGMTMQEAETLMRKINQGEVY